MAETYSVIRTFNTIYSASEALTFSLEVTMPYATGETPEIGDYIKNHWEQPGTVKRVHSAHDEEERICISWDDGGVELLFSPASEYTLVSRRST